MPLITTNPITAAASSRAGNNSSRPAIPPSGFADKPYKKVVLSSVCVLLAFAFGYAYFEYIGEGVSPWWMVAALAGFCIASVVRAIVEHDRWTIAGVFFLEALAMTAPFVAIQSWKNFSLVLFLVFVFLMWGYSDSREEQEKSLEIRFFKVAHPYVGKIVTAAVLMGVIFYLPIVQAKDSVFSEASFNKFLEWSATIIRPVYPGFDPHSSIGSAAARIAEDQVAGQPAFLALSEPMQKNVIQQSVSSTIGSLNNALKISVSADEPIETALYHFLLATLSGWRERFGTWFFVAWVLLIFLLVRSLGFFFSLAVSFVSFIVFYLLVALRVVEIASEPRMKEVARM